MKNGTNKKGQGSRVPCPFYQISCAGGYSIICHYMNSSIRTLDQVPKDHLKHNLLHLKYADQISTTAKRYVLMGTNTTLYTQAVCINVRTIQPLQILTLFTILHNKSILIRGTGIFMACTSMKIFGDVSEIADITLKPNNC